MHRLSPETLVTIITTQVLEERVLSVLRKRGASGYTMLRARGAGAEGAQSGTFDSDTNLMIKVVLPPERVTPVLDDLDKMIRKGYHLTVFATDVQVLGREKFERPMEP